MEATKFFSFGDQWNVVHFPEKPNGFAILIIGDVNHYVDEETSLWIQNLERFRLIELLCEQGYTVFYSNLYGRHWGSDKTFEYLRRLNAYMMRTVILNSRIHLLAEGMGALPAMKLMERTPETIRSAAFLSPLIDLKNYLQNEKENRVFYKRIITEIKEGYALTEGEDFSSVIDLFDLKTYQNTVPLKIWHATNRTNYPVRQHSRVYEAHRKALGHPIMLSLHMFEKRFAVSDALIRFFESNEHEL
ncbi:alpha/beta hydrolase family protein [Bacillus solimangrovi]|uniref:Hydrolase n=1 Tax=Bacillus solimangrovi TaxID=1305675 RepID=A0A1E5LC35_9BACI|nr:hypothetical protein [Bacillus solimangrovi]OEH91631.1 hypothetical protein BFG57_04475 [Bacillus solimangrovi]